MRHGRAAARARPRADAADWACESAVATDQLPPTTRDASGQTSFPAQSWLAPADLLASESSHSVSVLHT